MVTLDEIHNWNDLTPDTAARFLEEFKELSASCTQLAAECDEVTVASIMATVTRAESSMEMKDMVTLLENTLNMMRELTFKNILASLVVVGWLPDDEESRERLTRLSEFHAKNTEKRIEDHHLRNRL